MKLVQHGHYLKFSSMDESYFSELVSDEPNQIKARANTNDISNRFINQVDTYLYLQGVRKTGAILGHMVTLA